jgi:parvulin-like peptidyl-prolyl isomerase
MQYMAKALEQELFQYILQLDEAEKKAPQISVEQYNKEIDEAIARVEAGEFYKQEEVERMSKQW